MSVMNDLATKLMELRSQKESLKQQTKDNNAAIEQTENELASIMLEEGNDNFSLNGYKFILQYKDMFSSKVEFREQLIDALKMHGIDRDEIITETIPAPKLNSIMKNIYEENGEELPEEFVDIVTVFSKSSVMARKATGKSKAGTKF